MKRSSLTCFVALVAALLVPTFALAQATGNIKIAVIGDTQLGHGQYLGPLNLTGSAPVFNPLYTDGDSTVEREDLDEAVLYEVLDQLKIYDPDVVVLPGDIVNSGMNTGTAGIRQTAKMVTYINALEAEGWPVIIAMGNHDVGTNDCDIQVWNDPFGDGKERIGAHEGRADTIWAYDDSPTDAQSCTLTNGTKYCDAFAAKISTKNGSICFAVLPPYYAGVEGPNDGAFHTEATADAAISSTNSTLTDTRQNWAIQTARDAYVEITGGTGSGQLRTVTSQITSDTVTVSPDWTTNPDSTSSYRIHGNGPDQKFADTPWVTTNNCPTELAGGTDTTGYQDGRCDSGAAANGGGQCDDDTECGGTVGACRFCDSWVCRAEDATTRAEDVFDHFEAEIDTALTAANCDHEFFVAHHQLFGTTYGNSSGRDTTFSGPLDHGGPAANDYRERVADIMCARSKMIGAINGHVTGNLSFNGAWRRNSDPSPCANDFRIFSSEGATKGYSNARMLMNEEHQPTGVSGDVSGVRGIQRGGFLVGDCDGENDPHPCCTAADTGPTCASPPGMVQSSFVMITVHPNGTTTTTLDPVFPFGETRAGMSGGGSF
jgi:hypothetical protein